LADLQGNARDHGAHADPSPQIQRQGEMMSEMAAVSGMVGGCAVVLSRLQIFFHAIIGEQRFFIEKLGRL
jgi:hypothetical protein